MPQGNQVFLSVPDISCDACARHIAQALMPEPGLEEVRVDVPSRLVVVRLDEAVMPREEIERRLAAIGYPVASVQESAERGS